MTFPLTVLFDIRHQILNNHIYLLPKENFYTLHDFYESKLLDRELMTKIFPGSADSGIAEQPSVMTAEARVLQEVLDSEAVYVSDLNEVIEVSA